MKNNKLTLTMSDVSRRRLTLILALIASLSLAEGVIAQTSTEPAPASLVPAKDAAILLKQTTDSLVAAIDANRGAIRHNPNLVYELVDQYTFPHMDYGLISRRALGKHWRHASAEQRSRFTDVFRSLLVRSYVDAIVNYSFGRISYLPSRVRGGGQLVTVRTEVPQRNGQRVSIYYHMHQRSGSWQVFDLTIEGLSLVDSYRADFSARIRQKGLDVLIEQLSANLQSNLRHSAHRFEPVCEDLVARDCST